MPIKIDLNRAVLADALTQRIQLLKRGIEREINPGIKELRQKDIAELQTAINTMTEIK